MDEGGPPQIIKVLHVDDNQDFIDLVTIRLRHLSDHISIEHAGNGLEALSAIESQEYNCVLCDYDMPEMDGFELLKNLRKRGNKTPVILLSSSANERVISSAREAGADDYCTKESDEEYFNKLLKRIREVVRNHRRSILPE
jgi:CheY-like chemotaxis protein